MLQSQLDCREASPAHTYVEKQTLILGSQTPLPRPRSIEHSGRRYRFVIGISVLISVLVFMLMFRCLLLPDDPIENIVWAPTACNPPSELDLKPVSVHLQGFQECSIENLKATGLSFLHGVDPIGRDEFVSRRDRLAKALSKDAVDAFIVEPGFTFSYYANITQKDWEVWEPEERPFLMIVHQDPEQSSNSAFKGSTAVGAKTWFLVPSFEAERARLLGMPFKEELELITYEEHEDPYAILSSYWQISDKDAQSVLMVDEEMRDFIARGLQSQTSFKVIGLGGEVERVRQRKTAKEAAILRAVNTGTVESIRAMRKCMEPGLTEDEVALVLDNTMISVGLDPFFDIVLFDENASNPHGGTKGGKVLEKNTLVLIDVGSHLYGYSSDVCRTFFPPFSKRPYDEDAFNDLDEAVQEKLHVWKVVFEAQSASLKALTLNHTAADVDLAARDVIDHAGYGKAFTHRVGHGIGIKAHESPYLHKGNTRTELKSSMVFTSEPGVYLVGKFGVRHEDVLLVTEEGPPEILSGVRAKSPWEP